MKSELIVLVQCYFATFLCENCHLRLSLDGVEKFSFDLYDCGNRK